jgi:hypothetical protein
MLMALAQNRALDHLRRYEARMGEPLDAAQDSAIDPLQSTEKRYKVLLLLPGKFVGQD